MCLFFHVSVSFPPVADIEPKNNYKYQVEEVGSLPNSNQIIFKLRDKREVSTDNKAATSVSVPPPSGTVPSTKSNDSNQTQPITLENNKRLLGVNGTGQRLNISTPATGVKPAIVSEPLNSDGTKPSKGLTSIKSIATPNTNTTIASTTLAPEFEDRIIADVDTPEENINKTLRDNLNVTYKDD